MRVPGCGDARPVPACQRPSWSGAAAEKLGLICPGPGRNRRARGVGVVGLAVAPGQPGSRTARTWICTAPPTCEHRGEHAKERRRHHEQQPGRSQHDAGQARVPDAGVQALGRRHRVRAPLLQHHPGALGRDQQRGAQQHHGGPAGDPARLVEQRDRLHDVRGDQQRGPEPQQDGGGEQGTGPPARRAQPPRRPAARRPRAASGNGPSIPSSTVTGRARARSTRRGGG